MGLGFRKSKNIGGGFRINISPSGIGWSWGIKGMRFTKTARGTFRQTYYIPGTGIRYTKENKIGEIDRQSKIGEVNRHGVSAIKSDGVANEVNDSSRITRKLSSILSRRRDGIRLIWAGAIMFYITMAIGYGESDTDGIPMLNALNLLTFALLLAAAAKGLNKGARFVGFGLVALFTVEGIRMTDFGIGWAASPLLFCWAGIFLYVSAGKLKINYELGQKDRREWWEYTDAWKNLIRANKKQSVKNIKRVDGIHEWKVNSGASTLVETKRCDIGISSLEYIMSDAGYVDVKIGKNEHLLILKDKIIHIEGCKVVTVDREIVHFDICSTRFIEEGTAPKDATVVGETWKYVNVNGTPDRRFKENRLLPICEYGVVKIFIPTGYHADLNLELHISDLDATKQFKRMIYGGKA